MSKMENVHGHELGHSAQPPATKKTITDPRADNPGTAAAASPIITTKKRGQRPNNRPAGNGNAPKPSRCVGILFALLRAGVSQPTWILQKELAESDVSSHQSRLLLTPTKVMKKTLQDLSMSDKAAPVVDCEHDLPVKVFDRLGREHAMTLKSTHDCRLIGGGWKQFVELNGLGKGDRVDVWGFRFSCGGLGMALLSHKKGDEVCQDDDDDKFDANELQAAEALLLLKDS